MKAHQFVGLANPVYLPDDVAVEIKIIPEGNRNVRSNTKRSAAVVKFVTRHETANFNAGADADMHYRYLMSNPSPAAGYNTVSDDRKVIQLTPYDEDTWAAGTAVGNRTSDHHELCVNNGIDHAKARRIAAAVDAGVLHSRGLQPSHLLQHNYWTGKNCPMLMRANNNAIWNGTYYPMVKQMYADIVAHVAGGSAKPEPTPTPQPTYEKASPVPALRDERPFLLTDGGAMFVRADVIVEAVRDTPRLKYAGGTAKVGPDVKKGERFGVDYLIVNDDKSLYWYTPWSTRIRVDDTRVIEGEV